MSSSTDRMKQAEDWGGTPLTPMLNHTGELNAARWLSSSQHSSARKVAGCCGERPKVRCGIGWVADLQFADELGERGDEVLVH